MQYDLVIVGGGIIGLATAYHLSQQYNLKEKKILVVEQEAELAFHQTGHNSGVIHSGIYYKPGSLKALNCNKGRKQLVDFAKEYKITHDVCGKIIVATKESELEHQERIFNNGISNGTEGLEWMNSDQIKDVEPYCEGIKAIWVPCAGIIDYRAMARKYAEIFQAAGGEIKLQTKVLDFNKANDGVEIKTSKGKIESKRIVVCGGSNSDRLAKAFNLDPGMRIVGFRGEYYELVNMEKVRNLIYPVPNPSFPWLGVHFTRMTDGSVECGPNAVFAFKRNGYTKTDFDMKDTADAVTYIGFWKLITRHIAYGIKEQYRSLSKKAFLEGLQGLIPSLKMEDIKPGRAGVRALALAPDGNMIDDFKIVSDELGIHVLNAPSPAATASLAIGEQIAGMVKEKFKWA